MIARATAMMFEKFKRWARALRRDAHALYLCACDGRVPGGAKILAAVVAAYALSPIDLIPEFIPILGYLDDLILVPLGIWWALKLIPPHILAEHRVAAAAASAKPASRAAAAVVVAVWVIAAASLAWSVWRGLRS